MTDRPGFGVLLTRLLASRQTDHAWLTSASGLPESALRSVAEGAPPSATQLHVLATALGFHTADLFVIAGRPVPEPFEPGAASRLPRLISYVRALPADQRSRIRQTVDQLPQLPRASVADPPPALYWQPDGGFGAMLVTMLRSNRNVGSWSAAREILARLGDTYLSVSTVGGISTGRCSLRPDWLDGFARTLGIPAADLAAITGIDLPEVALPDDPSAAEAAELLWSCRRLTASQVEQVCVEAQAMLVAVPDDASSSDWNRVYRQHGTWWGAPRR